MPRPALLPTDCRLRPPLLALLTLAALSLLAAAVGAEPPPGYYAAVDASNAATLRLTLHEAIDDHTRFPYTADGTDTWDILELADQDPTDPDSILDVYRNATYPKAGGGNDNYQREHVWPNSYGFPDYGADNYPYTDCHALFLADGDYNHDRSNNPFRFGHNGCIEYPTVPNHGRGGTSGTYPGTSSWREGTGPDGLWETWIGRRGDVARALFYMDVRYEGGTHGISGHDEPNLHLTDDPHMITTSGGENAPSGFMGMLAVLRQWHQQDPVDGLERRRNDVVYSFQGNRNPFIDHPEWVECLYGGQCETTCVTDETTLCLMGGRFAVTVEWETRRGASGQGHSGSLTDESGYFWFFNQANVELMVKMVDACGSQAPRFWFFAAGLTDVETRITVVDTEAGATQVYENPQGTAFQPIQDTSAFATCADAGQSPVAEFSCDYERRFRCDFIDESYDPDGVVMGWNWDFGDGGTSIQQYPTHSYSSRGTYSVTLTVTDDDGLIGVINQQVDVCTPSWQCCKVCTDSQACGDSCIASHLNCHQPMGCACDSWEVCS